MKRLLALSAFCVLSGAAIAASTDLDHTFPLPKGQQAKTISLRMVYEKADARREKALSDFCAEWLWRVSPASKGARCQDGVNEPGGMGKPEVRYLLGEGKTRGGVTITVPKFVRKHLLHYTIDGAASINWNTWQDEITMVALPGYRGKAVTGDH